MKPLRWTQQAVEDLVAIRAYVARDSAHYADLLIERIFLAAERIEDFPLSGRIVPEFDNPSIREVVHGNYRIVYRDSGSALDILTVFHAARLLRLD